MKRILCLWFPNWPIQRRLSFRRDAQSSERSARARSAPLALRVAAKQEIALILHAPIAGKPRVTACSREARRWGIKPGMLLAEAEALAVGEGIFEPHDPQADRDALRRLAHWCQQFTPLAAVENAETPDSLLLDVTGCRYGFGGLEGLAKTAVECQFFAVAAIADTVGAAWAVAHHGD